MQKRKWNLHLASGESEHIYADCEVICFTVDLNFLKENKKIDEKCKKHLHFYKQSYIILLAPKMRRKSSAISSVGRAPDS